MKKILFLLFFTMIIFSCKKDDISVFGIDIPIENIRIKPTSGGAIMHYKLPKSKEIHFIQVEYKNDIGKETIMKSSIFTDSLNLLGFNKPSSVNGKVFLINKNGDKSKGIDISFNTNSSGAYAFFETLSLEPYWNGFSIKYETPEGIKPGFAHVFYLKHHSSIDVDTTFVGTFEIKEKENIESFILKKGEEGSNTVIIRTEDLYGNIAKESVYEVESYMTEYLDSTKFKFSGPKNEDGNDIMDTDLYIEKELHSFYLFDRDVKGYGLFRNSESETHFETFAAGPNATNKPFIFEFDEPEKPSYIDFYAPLYVRNIHMFHTHDLYEVFGSDYENRIPCSIDVFVSNDKTDDDSWVKLGDYEQSSSTESKDRWCYTTIGTNQASYNDLKNEEAIGNKKPLKIRILLSVTPDEYKYMKVVFNDTFQPSWGNDVVVNKNKYVALQEIEVFAKKK